MRVHYLLGILYVNEERYLLNDECKQWRRDEQAVVFSEIDVQKDQHNVRGIG
jgi:hypothetical protein